MKKERSIRCWICLSKAWNFYLKIMSTKSLWQCLRQLSLTVPRFSKVRLETVYSWFQCSFRGFLLIVQAIVCNFILSLEKWDNLFFCHSQKPFFCTETFVDTANGRQNRHYFPILCIFTQALVDLTNNSQVFSLTLSWIFHLLAKKWFKKKSRVRIYGHQTDNRLRVVRVKICNVICSQSWGSKLFLWLLSF